MITLYVCMVCMNRSMAEPNTSQAYASTSRRRGNSVDVELQCQRFRAHITQFLNLPSYFLLNKTHKMKSKTKLDSQIISHYLDGRWFSLIDPHAHARILWLWNYYRKCEVKVFAFTSTATQNSNGNYFFFLATQQKICCFFYFQKTNELKLDSTSISAHRLAHFWAKFNLKHTATICDKW